MSELEKQQAHLLAEVAKLTKHSASLKTEIEELKGVGDTIKQVLKDYSQALPNLIRELKEDETYSETKMRMILCAVEKCKAAVDQKIAEYDRQIAEKTASLEQLKNQKVEAENQLKQAQEDDDEKEARYKYWSELKKDIEDKLKEITARKADIETEDDASHAASMYFLALELQRILRSVKIVCTDDLKHMLYSASDEMSMAKELVRARESQLATATTDLDTAQADLADLKLKRRENILKKISVFDVPDQPKPYQGAK